MKEDVVILITETLYSMYNIKHENIERFIELPPESNMGDYSLPCFFLAKELKKNPISIAEEISAQIKHNNNKNIIDKAEAIKGYLNIYLNKELYINKILNKIADSRHEFFKEGNGRTICIDYSSPNIAKNFHAGHLRTTMIGNSMYKIYKRLGYEVIRINHLGDWGTQFGKLITAYTKWSSREQVEEQGIKELMRIYTKFNDEAEKLPELYDEARAWFIKMENGDEKALSIWQWFTNISMKEYQIIYNMLNIEFDSYIGESFYMDKTESLILKLKEKKLLFESNGAMVVHLDEHNMPPCLIVKKDGGSIYPSRDLAAAIYRKQTYNFDKCIYVTGNEQKLHFMQVFNVLKLMGYEWAEDMIHASYGLVSLEGEKLSSRKGNVIYAEDILYEAIKRSKVLMEEKGYDGNDIDETAKKIGIGAVIFNDLRNYKSNDINFSWKDVLNMNGMSAPYIQYTYTRAKSILKNEENIILSLNPGKYLKDEESILLIKQIERFPEVVKEAGERYEPSIIAKYVYQLAVLFNKFYHEHNILRADDEVKKARLQLTYVLQKMINESMELLGIECPEKM